MFEGNSRALVLSAVVVLVVALVSSTVALGESPRKEDGFSNAVKASEPDQTIGNFPSSSHLATKCLLYDGPFSAAYDAANGYLYVMLGDNPPQIVILKSTCTVVKTITVVSGMNGWGVAYDPLTKEIVGIDSGTAQAYIIQGSTLVTKVSLLGSQSDTFCPETPAWDASLRAMLITDPCGPGIDILYLADSGGVTHAATIIDAFDGGNVPTGVLVADGYIFCPGFGQTDVYNDRSLHFVGSFPIEGQTGYTPLAWDPLNHTVVIGLANGYSSEDVYFLDVSGIGAHIFSFHNLRVHGILEGGVGGVAYSPATQSLYITAMGGNDVWVLSASGSLSHVYLQPPFGMWNAVYDPANHEVYVCGADLYVVS